MLLHRLVGGTTTKFQSFLSYSLESEWCVDGLTLAQVTRDQGAGNFQSFATWGHGREAAHQPCRLQGQDRAGLGAGAWAAMGHRCTDTKEKFMALTLLLYPLDSEGCTPMYCGTPDLCLAALTYNTHPLIFGWYCMWFFSFLHPSFFQFISQFTSAFEGRVGTALSQPGISAAVVAEATLFDCFVLIQGTYTNSTPTEEPEKMKHKPIRDIWETFRENKCLTHLFFRQKSNVGFSEVYKVAKWVDFNEVSKNTFLTSRVASAWVPTLRHGSHKPVWMFHHEGNNAFFFPLFSETAMPLKQKCKNKWTKQILLEADTQHGELQARWLVWQS